MSDASENRRKRLIYQSHHRGTKESDLLLGAFAAAHLGGFDDTQLDQYEALLNEDDGDIFNWMTRRASPPAEKLSGVLKMLLSFQFPGAS